MQISKFCKLILNIFVNCFANNPNFHADMNDNLRKMSIQHCHIILYWIISFIELKFIIKNGWRRENERPDDAREFKIETI